MTYQRKHQVFFTYIVISYQQDKELRRRTEENQSAAILVVYSALSIKFLKKCVIEIIKIKIEAKLTSIYYVQALYNFVETIQHFSSLIFILHYYLLPQKRDEIGKAMEQHFQTGGIPPMVNICPPSPQNNDETKVDNFGQ